MSITLSLIAVFIPLFLMGGYVGLLFREFAVAVSVALVLSLLISLTLTPMMCARLLRHEAGSHGWLYRLLECAFDRLLNIYEISLKIALRHRFGTLLLMLGTIAFTGYLYVVMPKGFFPQQDTGLHTRPSRPRRTFHFRQWPSASRPDRCCAAGSRNRLVAAGTAPAARCNAQHRSDVHCAEAENHAMRLLTVSPTAADEVGQNSSYRHCICESAQDSRGRPTRQPVSVLAG